MVGRIVAGLGLALALLAGLVCPADGAAGAPLVPPPPLEVGWGARLAARTLTPPGAVLVEALPLPDGATLALVHYAGAVSLSDGTGRADVDDLPSGGGFALGRLHASGRPAWLVPVLTTGSSPDPASMVDLVRTDDGRVRVVASGDLAVPGVVPVDGWGVAVVEIDPAAGTLLGASFVADTTGGGVAATAAGDDLVVTAAFTGTVHLGAAEPRSTMVTSGSGVPTPASTWVARFDPDLQPRWAIQIGTSAATTGYVQPRDVALAADGDVHLAARHDRTVVLPDGSTVTAPLQQTRSLWLRLGGDGTFEASLPVPAQAVVHHLVVGGAPGSVVLAGEVDGTVTFGSGPDAVTLLGQYRRWVGSFAGDGTPRWVRQVAGAGAYATTATPPVAAPGGATLLALRSPVQAAVFAGSVLLPAGQAVMARVVDDGTATALGTLPTAAVPTGVAAAPAAPVVFGSLGGLARFGERPGAPVVEAAPGGFVVGGAVPAAGTGVIAGTVTDGAGPVGGAVVTVVAPPMRPVATVRTTTDGTWSVGALAAGTYKVRVTTGVGARGGRWYPDAPDAGSAVGLVVGAGTTSVADVALPAPGTARLQVQVSVASPTVSGTPVVVQLFVASGFVGSAPVRWYGSEPHERADLARLPAGTYYVRVIDPASGRSAWNGTGVGTGSTPAVLTDGTTTSLVFAL